MTAKRVLYYDVRFRMFNIADSLQITKLEEAISSVGTDSRGFNC